MRLKMTEEDTDTLRCSMLEVMLLTQSLLRLSECSGEEDIPQLQTLYFSVFLLLYVMFKDWPKQTRRYKNGGTQRVIPDPEIRLSTKKWEISIWLHLLQWLISFLTVYTVTAYSVCSKSRNFVLLENCVQYVDSHSVNWVSSRPPVSGIWGVQLNGWLLPIKMSHIQVN